MDYHLSTAAASALMLLVAWELVWKGLALWRASKRDDKGWFVAILIINSAGLLPILYLIFTNPKKD